MTDWAESLVPFHFRVTELNLLTVHRRLAIRRLPLRSEATPELSPGDSVSKMRPGFEGLLFRSMEIEKPLPTLSLCRDYIRYVPKQYRRHYVDLTLTPEAYEAKFSSKSRSTLRRKVRKLARASGGELDWREYKIPAEMSEFYELARGISRQTYQERLLDAGLPDSAAFQARMLKAAEKGEVRGYLVFLKERAVAYLYCPIANGVLEYAYLGYLPEPEIVALSPGTVLLWLVIQQQQREGTFQFFDFTEGDDRRRKGQKSFFATGSKLCADVYYLRRTAANFALATLHGVFNRGVELFGDLLERMGVRTRARSWLRRTSTSMGDG